MHIWEDQEDLLSSLCPQGNTDLHGLLSDFQPLSIGLKSHGHMIIVLKILNWIKRRITYKNKSWNRRSICCRFAPHTEIVYFVIYMKKYICKSLAGYSVSICMWLCLNTYCTDLLDCYRNPGSFPGTSTSQVHIQVNALNIGLRFPLASLEIFNSQQRNLNRVKCLPLRDTADILLVFPGRVQPAALQQHYSELT